jgi:hypothetical protein
MVVRSGLWFRVYGGDFWRQVFVWVFVGQAGLPEGMKSDLPEIVIAV